MSHGRNISPTTPLASARQALWDLPPTYPGLWLDQPQCAEAKALIGLVLLHELSGLLVVLGKGEPGRG